MSLVTSQPVKENCSEGAVAQNSPWGSGRSNFFLPAAELRVSVNLFLLGTPRVKTCHFKELNNTDF